MGRPFLQSIKRYDSAESTQKLIDGLNNSNTYAAHQQSSIGIKERWVSMGLQTTV